MNNNKNQIFSAEKVIKKEKEFKNIRKETG